MAHLVVGRRNLLFGAEEELARGQGDPIGRTPYVMTLW